MASEGQGVPDVPDNSQTALGGRPPRRETHTGAPMTTEYYSHNALVDHLQDLDRIVAEFDGDVIRMAAEIKTLRAKLYVAEQIMESK